MSSEEEFNNIEDFDDSSEIEYSSTDIVDSLVPLKDSQKLTKVAIEKFLEDAWLGIDVDEKQLFNPMDFVFHGNVDNREVIERISYLMSQPEYFYFTCKYILNIELLPFQTVILQELWGKKFPMLIGSRGLGKSFILAVYSILRCLLMPRRKIIVVGAAFRQSKVIFEYMETIWKNAPILRDLCDSNSGPVKDIDRCVMRINGGTVTCLPLGDGCLCGDTLVTYHDRIGYINNPSSSIWGNGKFRNIDYPHINGLSETKIIKTKMGFEYESTLNHKMQVFRNQKVQWIRADDIEIGDRILIDKTERWHSGIGNHSNSDYYTLGAMIGDGNYTNKYHLGFATKDLEIINSMNINFKQCSDNVHWKICGKKIVEEWLNKWGMDLTYTKNKKIPDEALKCTKGQMRYLLRGIFDTDGNVSCISNRGNSGYVGLTNTSKNLIKQVQYILLHFGIVSHVKIRNRKKEWSTIYELLITGNDIEKFKSIGFGLSRKNNILNNISIRKNRDDIPVDKSRIKVRKERISITSDFLDKNYPELSKEYRIDEIYYDTVSEINNGKCETYDIHVPENNIYCANGFFSHNTKIRGQRAHDIINDEFSSMPREIFENVVAGFAAVSASPLENVKRMAKEKAAIEKNVKIKDKKYTSHMANQIILAGTAYYEFNHFAQEWKKYKKIIDTKGDKAKIQELLKVKDIGSFNYNDYTILRIPVTTLPDGFMDSAQINRARATVHSGIFQMEYGSCQFPDTEIITPTGTKKIIDIQIGDLVLTHKGRFMPVTKLMYRNYTGDIIKFNTYGYYDSYHFTPEHPFFINGDFIPLSSVGENTELCNLKELSGLTEINACDYTRDYMDNGDFIYPKSSRNKTNTETRKIIQTMIDGGASYKEIEKETGTKYTTIWSIVKCPSMPKSRINSKLKLDYDLGICFGYYASEGSTGRGNRVTEFALDGHIDDDLMFLKNQLIKSINKAFGVNALSRDSKNVSNVYFNSRVMGDIFKNICPGLCYSKVMNKNVLFSNQDFLKGFIIGIFNGDGHIRREFSTISLTSKNLIYQIKIALSYFGISCSIRMPKIPNNKIIMGKEYNLKQVYKLNIYGDNHRKFVNKFFPYKNLDDCKIIRSQKIRSCNDIQQFDIISKETIQYNGFVYNLEVEGDNSYSIPTATVHNCFTSDSQGFFKRSLIESCTCSPDNVIKLPSGNILFDAALRGSPDKKYVYGIDPASEVDNFSIIVLEVNKDHRRIVYCWTTTRTKHKEQLKTGLIDENDFYAYCCRKIRNLMKVFPCKEIALDSQGGGVAIIEGLHDKDKIRDGEMPIWPTIEPDKEKDTDDMPGLHIVKMCNFAKADWLGEANHGLRKDLEDKVILFPYFDTVSLGLSLESDKRDGRVYDTLEDCFMEIEELKNELSMITVTLTPSGREHWDTPSTKVATGKKDKLRKDRYSALIMANMSARQTPHEVIDASYYSTGGFAQINSSDEETSKDYYIGPNWFTQEMGDMY